MSAETMITVEVAFARPDKQILKQLSVPQGTTAMEAVKQSGILSDFPEIDADSDKMGVFSQVLGTKGLDVPAVYKLQSMDRVEIYSPLKIGRASCRERV